MGITGLIPLLKKATKRTHIKHFSTFNYTAGIDAFGWLHKGAFGCAVKLGKGEPTNSFVTYCIKYVNVLLEHNIKPVLVFDGRSLPSKEITNKKRREAREESKALAKEMLRQGRNGEAREYFIKAVEITHAMTRMLILELQRLKIDYIIAPYEADAQLANLAINGIIDIVITEDSDLVLFGCPKIFFKMSVDGDGDFYDKDKLPKCFDIPPSKFNFARFRQMCILSGCDYLPSIPGIGLTRAKKVFLNPVNLDPFIPLEHILRRIPFTLAPLDCEVTDEYIKGFERAEATFQYQIVFDVLKRELIPLTEYDASIDQSELGFAGEFIDNKIALQLALGNIEPKSFTKVASFDPNLKSSGYKDTSIWSQNFKVKGKSSLAFNAQGRNAMEIDSNKSQASGTFGKRLVVSLNRSLSKFKYEPSGSHLKDVGLLMNDDLSEKQLREIYKTNSSGSNSNPNEQSSNEENIEGNEDSENEVIEIQSENEEDSDEELFKSPQKKKRQVPTTDEDESQDEGRSPLLRRSQRKSNPFVVTPKSLKKTTKRMGNGSIITTIEQSPEKSPIIHKSTKRLRLGDVEKQDNRLVKSRYFKPIEDEAIQEPKKPVHPIFPLFHKSRSLASSTRSRSTRSSVRANFLEGTSGF